MTRTDPSDLPDLPDLSDLSEVEKITRTCLYEGYLLWPYRRSALKNAKRWTFGGVFPAACADALGEPAAMTTRVLHEGPADDLTVRVRFLQVVNRTVTQYGRPVDALTVGGERYVSWQEVTEREVVLTGAAGRAAVDLPEGTDTEELPGGDACLVREWQRLTGTVEVTAEPVADGVRRLTVRISNSTACPVPDPGTRHTREEAASYAFVSTHTVLHSDRGRFVSLLDPPASLRDHAAACRNEGTWPVLVGTDQGDGRARTVLSSPVTLYDFPRVAPESPGDLFDGTEIDQLLVLSVLSLTEEERAEARASDPRAREILDRCAGLGTDDLMALHGTIREFNAAPREGK
ncbi:hypothetical protein F7R91_29525 [Streptomyces luteolifulvus]|uniref:Hydrogenase maturation protease n=1 Tax=Streptomyces luteolifulvus TaxID=2615112 RepID=A0A6H9UVT0_9ACTN|nr:hypothetical protein [Streptomyces luteolifulvus]KAB1142386.1 hypothetical protein F7R91_29525 [Streptomyces luteolifulvus]